MFSYLVNLLWSELCILKVFSVHICPKQIVNFFIFWDDHLNLLLAVYEKIKSRRIAESASYQELAYKKWYGYKGLVSFH